MDPRRRARAWAAGGLGLVAAGLIGADFALAANEAHVRTPVLWPSECARIVDRSVDPIARFDYAIPVEDTELTADELPDGRTHQFVAVCRDRALTELLPSWITRDDVERSATAGLIPDPGVDPAAILDESEAWAGCFERITADDARRPITFEQAALGVAWDTSAVAAGVWHPAGYTFEPPFNLWRGRPGFVKIVDDRDDPAQDLPAVALLGEEQLLEPGAELEIAACVDFLGPGTLTLEWAELAPTLDWQPWAELTVDADGPLDLEVDTPIAAAGRELLVRARLTDALGRTRVAHLPAKLALLPCPEGGCPELPDPGDPADPADPADPEPSGGCAVTEPTDPSGAPAFPLLAMLVTVTLVARRRPRTQNRPVALQAAPPKDLPRNRHETRLPFPHRTVHRRREGPPRRPRD